MYIDMEALLDSFCRLRRDGWMMDDLGVIIQVGWMIWAATWMMGPEKRKRTRMELLQREMLISLHVS